MRNGRIKYFSILGVVLFLYLTTSVYSLLICTYILLILPILSLVISLPGMRHVDVEKTHEHFIAKRNHLAYLHFKRVPYKHYPSALIKIDYEYIQTICNQKNSYKVYMEDEQTDIILLRNHVGHCDLTITRFRCYDLLGLFYHTTRCQKKCSMYIEPNLIDIEQEVKKLEVFVDDSELYSPYRYGNDYSELYEIRQYRQGDSLKHINWKSTLQRQDIYVNIGSQPIVKNVLVTILITDDFNENDIAYDYFHSLCHKMLNQEIDFDIIFQNITMDHYVIYHINCYDNYKDVLYKMLSYKIPSHQRYSLSTLNYQYGCLYTATSKGIEEERLGGYYG